MTLQDMKADSRRNRNPDPLWHEHACNTCVELQVSVFLEEEAVSWNDVAVKTDGVQRKSRLWCCNHG